MPEDTVALGTAFAARVSRDAKSLRMTMNAPRANFTWSRASNSAAIFGAAKPRFDGDLSSFARQSAAVAAVQQPGLHPSASGLVISTLSITVKRGPRSLKELVHRYLTITKDVGPVMSRVKAIYRSWAIPCTRKQV